jgi:predicted acetyltransferase
MATTSLRARHYRPDGQQLLRFERPALLAWDQAAAALAVRFAEEPVRVAIHTLVDGLQVAVKEGVVARLTRDRIATLNPRAVQTYRDVLRESEMFPHPPRRKAMLAELQNALENARRAKDQQWVREVQSKQPRIWAKHEIEKGEFAGEPGVRVDVQHFFTLERAAIGCALVAPTRQTRFGERTVRHLLNNALDEGLLSKPGVAEQVKVVAEDEIERAAQMAYERFANPEEGDVKTLRDKYLSRWPAPPAAVAEYKAELRRLRVFD